MANNHLTHVLAPTHAFSRAPTLRRWWASHTKARLVVPFVLATALVGFSFLPDPQVALDLPDIPQMLVIDNQTVDMSASAASAPSRRRLGLTVHDPVGQRLGAQVINPSLLVHSNRVHVVARRHRRETRQRSAHFSGPQGTGDAVVIEQRLEMRDFVAFFMVFGSFWGTF